MKTILITGGAGFIGSNATKRFLEKGDRVVVLDDLSRSGSAENLEWLRGIGTFAFEECDVRDAAKTAEVVRRHRPAALIHLAGQVAVTTSVADPRSDFEINALGTLNVLEAVRLESPDTIVVNASTNKVYGKAENLVVEERGGRWSFRDLVDGVSEAQPLDFHSPYGCSKGVADQYTIDYSRIYGLRTLCFRQSCIYGTRQMGVEDQGWVAWFTIAAVLGLPISIYGDGRQVRDLLWVDDLIDLYQAGIAGAEKGVTGAFNVGGGSANTLSLLELLAKLEAITGRALAPRFEPWRPGDQKVFVGDSTRATRRLGWSPRTSVDEGLERLAAWVTEQRSLFERLYPRRD